MKSNILISKLIKKSFSIDSNLISRLTQMSITNTNSSVNLPFSHDFLINVNNQVASQSNKRNSLHQSIKKSFINENTCFSDVSNKANQLNSADFPLNNKEKIEKTVKIEETIQVDDVNIHINSKNPILDKENLPSHEYKARNNRAPKQANHGARPCSSVMRKLRLKKILNRGKLKTKDEL